MNPRKCLLTQASQLPRLSSSPFFRPQPLQWPSLSPVRGGQRDGRAGAGLRRGARRDGRLEGCSLRAFESSAADGAGTGLGREDGARDALERISDLQCPGKDISVEEQGIYWYHHSKAFQAGAESVWIWPRGSEQASSLSLRGLDCSPQCCCQTRYSARRKGGSSRMSGLGAQGTDHTPFRTRLSACC